MVNDKRSIGVYILLSIITCGIYPLIFVYGLINDMNTVCAGDGDETPDFLMYILLSFITCGIYAIYWDYKLANRQQNNAYRYDIQISENGTTVLVWILIGGLFFSVGYWVAKYIIIKNMNALAFAYNKQFMNPDSYGGQGGYGQQGYNDGQNYGNDGYYNNSPIQGNTINLRCTAGEFAGNEFGMESGVPIVIGRDTSCNIKLNANTPNVSRRHCTVTNENGTVYVVDNNSSFGTYLDNGTKLSPNVKTVIQRGSGFYLGSRNVSFKVE